MEKSNIKYRDYQEKGVGAAVDFLRGRVKFTGKDNALGIYPTGAGKSVILSGVAKEIGEPIIVLQPSKEILSQNLEKYESYGLGNAGVYSASLGRKELENEVNFATIGSVYKKPDLFRKYRYIFVDECHLVNPEDGMYRSFIKDLGVPVYGLTGTPYRMYSNSFGTVQRFLTRIQGKIFHHVVDNVDNKTLFDNGYLCMPQYNDVYEFDRSKLVLGSGGEYTQESVKAYYKSDKFFPRLVQVVNRLVEIGEYPLVFTKFREEAEMVARNIPNMDYVDGDTPPKERDEALRRLGAKANSGVVNVGVFTTGVDVPILKTVVLALPMRSYISYQQRIGRAFRLHPEKQFARVVDLCGNVKLFGKVENYTLGYTKNGQPQMMCGDQPFTNVYY